MTKISIDKLVIGKPLPPSLLKSISDRLPGVKIVITETEEDQARELNDADVLFTRILPKEIRSAVRLKWVQFMWEGIDAMSSELKESNILLTNAGGAHAIQIAEHVFAYILNLSRQNRMYIRHQDNRYWLPWKDQPELKSLHGSTIGIIGYGRLGKAIATIAKGFGMKIIALKRNPGKQINYEHQGELNGDPNDIIPDRIMGPEGLSYLLGRSDHVVVTLPLTEETEGLIGRNQFKEMKRTAFFINVGRGRIVDEHSLIEAIKTETIAGAGLDVFYTEPLPLESPLWDMENVLITPHSSVGGDPADKQVVDIFLENLNRIKRGESLINLMDKSRGY